MDTQWEVIEDSMKEEFCILDEAEQSTTDLYATIDNSHFSMNPIVQNEKQTLQNVEQVQSKKTQNIEPIQIKNESQPKNDTYNLETLKYISYIGIATLIISKLY